MEIFDEIAPTHRTDTSPHLIVGTRHSLLYYSLDFRLTNERLRDIKIREKFVFVFCEKIIPITALRSKSF
jgi:hypothetical protein